MEYASTFEEEQARLERVLKAIQEYLKELEEKSREATEYWDQLQKSAKGDSPEFYQELPVAAQIKDMYQHDLLHTKRISGNPYFGKLIFLFEREWKDQVIYLGKKGINSMDTPENEIIDWRTPIADVYYSGKMGHTSYQAPQGLIQIDLKLKSTLKIREGQLLSVYDSETVVNDDLLTEYLSQNKSVVLNEIIATIQEDQNAIIRKPFNTNVVVQGVAGSGKTTVALHRISYLLYNYNEMVSAESICLIAANRLFLNYITAMLPDLDVPVLRQGIMEEILVEALQDYHKKFGMPELVTGSNPVYENTVFIRRITEYLKELESQVFETEGVCVLGFALLSKEEIQYYNRQTNHSMMEKARRLDGYIDNRLKSQKEAIIQYVADHRRDPAIAEFAEAFFQIDRNQLFTFNLTKNFTKFTAKYKKYFAKRVEKLNCLELFRQFTSHSGKGYSLNDLACLLFFDLRIKGKTRAEGIRHVVIDEAQDFNVVIYCCLRELYREASFTIVGDVMQNINHTGLAKWDPLLQQIFTKDTEYIELLKSYRNTIEISRFAEKLMQWLGLSQFKVEPLIRHGQTVQLYSYQNIADQIRQICEILLPQKQEKLIAIICLEEDTVKMAGELLDKASLPVILLDTKNQSLQQGTYVMSVMNAKGLEFDTVILWDFDSYIDKKDILFHKRLYVAITRALHNLYLFTNNPEVKHLSAGDT